MSVDAFAKQIQQFDTYKVIKEIISKSNVLEWIKSAPKKRIQQTGVDALGNELRTDKAATGENYSALTIILKEKKSGIGGIDSHVTLTDTGQFWNSIKVLIKDRGFEIIGNFEKSEGHMYKNFTFSYPSKKDFENAIEGLNEAEQFTLVEQFIYPEFVKRLNAIF